jgi:DNA-binding MarR family transcriptional regulator
VSAKRKLGDEDYARLLDFRYGLRTFLHWSGEEARKHDLTPTQHQLLLAVRGHEGPRGPTITDAAESLLLRHHSAVELVDRAESAGLVTRTSDPDDQRLVRLRLTATGSAKLEAVTIATLEQLDRLSPRLLRVWDSFDRSIEPGEPETDPEP